MPPLGRPRQGSFGLIPAETATPLAMVLTELLQNSVEHGYGAGEEGHISLDARRLVGRLHVTVEDDVFLGPLVSVLAGELAPHEGSIFLKEQEITRWPQPRRARAGWVL